MLKSSRDQLMPREVGYSRPMSIGSSYV